jgi:hypothetical protein
VPRPRKQRSRARYKQTSKATLVTLPVCETGSAAFTAWMIQAAFPHRAARVARNLNYMRLMGGVVASSMYLMLPEHLWPKGSPKHFTKGLVPLAKNLKTFKVSAAEAKRYGVGVDVLMRGRSQIISDISDYTRGGTAFERGVQSLTDNFGRINLMDYWTAGVKQLHAVTMQNSVIDELLKGKIDKRLSRLGIDDANAMNIARATREIR